MKKFVFNIQTGTAVFSLMLTAFLGLQKLPSVAQTCSSYTVQRTTGVTYSSIAATGSSVASWRGVVANLTDDNRSFPVPIGFDFWYLGTRFTTVNISTNGFIDFSTSTYDGNWPVGDPAAQPPGYATCSGNISYREDGNALYNSPCGNGVAPNSFDGTYQALAPMYGDLICNGGSNLANSIRYKTTGTAPNRVFTAEYVGMDDKTGSGSNYNFQVKLSEFSGVIKFNYGTMSTAAVVPIGYSCGMNGIIVTNPPSAAELLTQQADNSASFGNANPGLHYSTPTSNSRLTFTPPVPANPSSSLTFSAVTTSSMTLNWTDWATNELGYVVYQSTDGTTYSYVTQTAAGTIMYTATGLNAGTTYWWKVYAVTEGCMSFACTGSQATSGTGTVTSVTTGNWSNPSTWDAGYVPLSTDNVIIADGHTVTLDGSYTCNNLTVGGGSSGKLFIGSSTSSVTFTVNGDIRVKSGAVLKANQSFASTHTMIASGHIANNGTINMRPVATSLCNVIFNKNGDQTISGTGGLTNFNLMTMQMGSSTANVLEVRASAFSAPSNFLTLNAGTFKFSVASAAISLDLFSSPVTINSSSMLWMNSPNSVMNVLSGVRLQGALKCTAGQMKIGDITDEALVSDGGMITLTNGSISVSGALDRFSAASNTTLSISGGSLLLNTSGTTSASAAPFTMDGAGSSFTMNGGTIIIRKASAAGLGYINNNVGTYSFTNGTLQIGDASTPALQTIQINTDRPVANLSVQSAGSPTALMTNSLTVSNAISIGSGATLSANSFNLQIGGDFTNDGSFISGTNNVTFNGAAAQQIAGTASGLDFNNLVIANTSGDVSLNYGGDIQVNGTMQFTSGRLILNDNNLVITSGNAITGFSSSRFVVTNGTAASGGVLQINNLTGTRDFPIGVSTNSYSPVLNFANAGIADNFQARVFQGVYQNMVSGAPVVMGAVDRTWLIGESSAGGSNVDLKLQWDTTAEQTGFNRAGAGISLYDAGLSTWDIPGITGPATANPHPSYTMNRTAINSFSGFYVHSGFTLPVELLVYDVKQVNGNSSQISWSTATETNNDYFTIERATASMNFQTIAIVKGSGNSGKPVKYQIQDAAPLSGVNYYRLKQTDLDGRTEYLGLKSVNFTSVNVRQIHTNFYGNKLNIKLNENENGPVDVYIYDGMARVIQSNHQVMADGADGLWLNCGFLATGRYYILIQGRSASWSSAFSRQ